MIKDVIQEKKKMLEEKRREREGGLEGEKGGEGKAIKRKKKNCNAVIQG